MPRPRWAAGRQPSLAWALCLGLGLTLLIIPVARQINALTTAAHVPRPAVLRWPVGDNGAPSAFHASHQGVHNGNEPLHGTGPALPPLEPRHQPPFKKHSFFPFNTCAILFCLCLGLLATVIARRRACRQTLATSHIWVCASADSADDPSADEAQEFGLQLRPYQQQTLMQTLEALKAHSNTLVVAPTGCGKTVMLSAIIGSVLRQGKQRVCVLQHRDVLTAQNHETFRQVNPNVSTSIVNATGKDWGGQVTFAMVQTLMREANLKSLPPLDLLVIDEAHHVAAEGYIRIVKAAQAINPDLWVLGLTATSARGDGKALRSIFSNVAAQIPTAQLVQEGHLVKTVCKVIDLDVQEELKKVKKVGNEFDMEAVAELMNTRPHNEAVVHHWRQSAADRKTVVFCSTVTHATSVAQCFAANGVPTVLLHSDLSAADRELAEEDYRSGRAQVIVNVAILTEGWDDPPTSCVVLLRPCSFKSTMIQMVGRARRTIDPQRYPGIIKRDCLVLDFGTSILTHGSFDDEATLEGKATTSSQRAHTPTDAKPQQECPKCQALIPAHCRECPMCGEKLGPKLEMLGSQDFRLSDLEIGQEAHRRQVAQLLQESPFEWVEVEDGKYMTAAFSPVEVWCVIMRRKDLWYAVGGHSKENWMQVLAVGEENVCIARGSDFMNRHESHSARKGKSWQKRPASEGQLKYVTAAQKQRFPKPNRFTASILLTCRFSATEKKLEDAITSVASRAPSTTAEPKLRTKARPQFKAWAKKPAVKA